MVKALKRVQTFAGAANIWAIRSIKMVQPACMVLDEKYKTMSTGPCQRAIKDDPMLAATWFMSCDHGPSEGDIEKAGYAGKRPPYFEVSYADVATEETELQPDGSLLVKPGPIQRFKSVKPRITQVALSVHVMSGEQLEFAKIRGFVPVREFGIADFCSYWNCWNQNIRKFLNGYFCGPLHAKLVKASEQGVGDTGKLIPIVFDEASAAYRRQWLASIDV